MLARCCRASRLQRASRLLICSARSRSSSSTGHSSAFAFSGRTVIAATAVGAVSAACAVRQLMLPATDPYASRPDGSQARIPIQPQAKRVVRVLFHDKQGRPQLARLDEAEFNAEAQRRATELEQARGSLLASSSSSLHRALDEVFLECQGPDRVRAFASWYYAYTTTYELMRVAASAGAGRPSNHAELARGRVRGCRGRRARKVRRDRPAAGADGACNAPGIREGLERCEERRAADDWARGRKVAPASREATRRISTSPEPARFGAQLSVDWRFARGTAAGIDSAHGRPSPMPSVALLGGGALLGKAIAGKRWQGQRRRRQRKRWRESWQHPLSPRWEPRWRRPLRAPVPRRAGRSASWSVPGSD